MSIAQTRGTPLVSLILPAYNSRTFLKDSVTQAANFFRDLKCPYEIICVDDGSTDLTGEIEFQDPFVRMVRHARNIGKGAAIRTGMMLSKGYIRVITDSDLPYGLDCVSQAVYYMLIKDYHLVIGDRMLDDSVYHTIVDWRRRIASQVFSFFVGRFITGGFYDTQCGFKAVRGEVADYLFPRLRINRFACDVELIYISLINNLDIKRIPVILQRNETSGVHLIRDSLQTLIDVLHMKYLRSSRVYEFQKPVKLKVMSAESATAAVRDFYHSSEENLPRAIS
jgi:glycosyltransferase involved in cell wall biosynthesis